MTRRLTALGDIKVVEMEFRTEPITEAVFWHPRLTLDPAHRWLRELLVRSSREIDLVEAGVFQESLHV